ncbi:carboxylesterase [Nitzschia inconspicua]|uniref:Carboxylesterase n=1 Tax=Nitzschia inconspicua TaxID=303405 RepID=A0A9K3KQH2_9STRA|nr:carboxylesterase [Nitzschia inconspicua]
MNIAQLLCWTAPIFIWNGFRLLLFVLSLAPGFVRFAWYYFVTADRVSVRYGDDSMRQTLDVYRLGRKNKNEIVHCNGENGHPFSSNRQDSSSATEATDNAAPVLVFYTGGGWMIGYKMWGSLLARALTAAGIVVVIPDMRNYPFATVPDMVRDADLSLEWTLQNIADYGGDQTKVVVVGQSAGGHVSFMAIMDKLRMMSRQNGGGTNQVNENSCDSWQESLLPTFRNTLWHPSDLKGLACISSPFHLKAMSDSFQKKGLDDHLVDRIFGYEIDKYDPFLAVKGLQETADGQQLLSQELPPIRIYHGTSDKTVPHDSSKTFYHDLKKSIGEEERLSFVSYLGWSHTDPILEGPMDADQTLHRDLFRDVRKWTGSTTLSWPNEDPIIYNRLCPHFMVQAGRFFNPF